MPRRTRPTGIVQEGCMPVATFAPASRAMCLVYTRNICTLFEYLIGYEVRLNIAAVGRNYSPLRVRNADRVENRLTRRSHVQVGYVMLA